MTRSVAIALEPRELAQLAELSARFDVRPSVLVRALVHAGHTTLEEPTTTDFEPAFLAAIVRLTMTELAGERLDRIRAERAGKDPTP